MVELVADLIKEGANVNEKVKVSLKRVLSASAQTGAPMRPPVAVCLRWCVSGGQGPCAGERRRMPRPLLSLWPRP